MSVRTTADDRFDEARDIAKDIISKIQDMENLINEATHPDTWGSNQYKSEFDQEINKLKLKTTKFKERLRKFINF